MAYLSLQGINKIYPNGFHAVHDFNLEIEKGEFICLVGPSGCGKSTTLRMIAGLETISKGDFLIDGVRANEMGPREREIAMVFQSYALYPHMSVYDNLAFGLSLQGVDDDVMTMDGLSITAHKDEITNPNVTYYYGYGLQGGHTEIWHSVESVEYQRSVAEELDKIYLKWDGEPPYDTLVDFYSKVDHRLYSEVNSELMDLILSTFDSITTIES